MHRIEVRFRWQKLLENKIPTEFVFHINRTKTQKRKLSIKERAERYSIEQVGFPSRLKDFLS